MRVVEDIKRNLVELPQEYEKAAHETVVLEFEYKKELTKLEALQAKKRLELKVTSKDGSTDRKDKVADETLKESLELVKKEADFRAAEVRRDALDKKIQTTRNLCNLACAEIYAGMHTNDVTYSIRPREDR
jgi:hypothetical protein